jgi:serine/threonine-protein kinase
VLGTSQKQEWAESLVGRTLGRRYRLERLLGVGGMGAVYEAMHQAMDRRVAVKVLLPSISDDEDYVRRFEREARAAAKVAGPGVPQLFDLDVDAEAGPFLVMEYLKGEGLDERLAREKTLSPERAIALTVELLDTLGPVHTRGIVHRDLKPANIFLTKTEDGGERIKVLDFGIARLLFGPDSLAQLTQPGAAVGTPSYMAPEQLRGDPDVDGRADLYSVGIVLYQMLSGQLPHPQNSMQALIAAVITGMPVNLASICPSLPEPLVTAVHRALSVVPDERFRDAAQMRETLLAVDLAGAGARAMPAPRKGADPSAPTALAVSTPSQPIPTTTPPPAGAPDSPSPTFSVPPRDEKSFPLVPVLVVSIVALLVVAGGFAAAFGFAITSSEPRESAPAAVAPVVAPSPVIDELPAPLRPADGWAPIHPMDVADPLPAPTAEQAAPDIEASVHEIVISARRLLDDGQVDAAAAALGQLSQLQLPRPSYAAENAATAYVALGDRLASRYGEDRDVPHDRVPATLAPMEARIMEAYTQASALGSPRYALCVGAKQAALQLLVAHTLSTWPEASDEATQLRFESITASFIAGKKDAARRLIEAMLTQPIPAAAPECRTAMERVLADLEAAP